MEIRINKTLQLFHSHAEIYTLYFARTRQYAINHTHSHFELHYITEGSTVYTMDFQDKIVLNAGEWLLINKNTYHEETVPYGCGGYVLAFDLPKESEKTHFDAFHTRRYHKGEKDPELGGILNRILKETLEQPLGFEDYRQSMFAVLFIHLLRCLPDRETAKSIEEDQRENVCIVIDRFFNWVFAPDTSSLTVGALAAELHVTPRHVNRLLRKYYGATFHEKLTESRIRFAAYLLESTDQSIAHISEVCGLTQASLITNFKKIHGVTPSAYRNLKKTDTV